MINKLTSDDKLRDERCKSCVYFYDNSCHAREADYYCYTPEEEENE